MESPNQRDSTCCKKLSEQNAEKEPEEQDHEDYENEFSRDESSSSEEDSISSDDTVDVVDGVDDEFYETSVQLLNRLRWMKLPGEYDGEYPDRETSYLPILVYKDAKDFCENCDAHEIRALDSKEKQKSLVLDCNDNDTFADRDDPDWLKKTVSGKYSQMPGNTVIARYLNVFNEDIYIDFFSQDEANNALLPFLEDPVKKLVLQPCKQQHFPDAEKRWMKYKSFNHELTRLLRRHAKAATLEWKDTYQSILCLQTYSHLRMHWDDGMVFKIIAKGYTNTFQPLSFCEARRQFQQEAVEAMLKQKRLAQPNASQEDLSEKDWQKQLARIRRGYAEKTDKKLLNKVSTDTLTIFQFCAILAFTEFTENNTPSYVIKARRAAIFELGEMWRLKDILKHHHSCLPTTTAGNLDTNVTTLSICDDNSSVSGESASANSSGETSTTSSNQSSSELSNATPIRLHTTNMPAPFATLPNSADDRNSKDVPMSDLYIGNDAGNDAAASETLDLYIGNDAGNDAAASETLDRNDDEVNADDMAVTESDDTIGDEITADKVAATESDDGISTEAISNSMASTKLDAPNEDNAVPEEPTGNSNETNSGGLSETPYKESKEWIDLVRHKIGKKDTIRRVIRGYCATSTKGWEKCAREILTNRTEPKMRLEDLTSEDWTIFFDEVCGLSEIPEHDRPGFRYMACLACTEKLKPHERLQRPLLIAWEASHDCFGPLYKFKKELGFGTINKRTWRGVPMGGGRICPVAKGLSCLADSVAALAHKHGIRLLGDRLVKVEKLICNPKKKKIEPKEEEAFVDMFRKELMGDLRNAIPVAEAFLLKLGIKMAKIRFNSDVKGNIFDILRHRGGDYLLVLGSSDSDYDHTVVWEAGGRFLYDNRSGAKIYLLDDGDLKDMDTAKAAFKKMFGYRKDFKVLSMHTIYDESQRDNIPIKIRKRNCLDDFDTRDERIRSSKRAKRGRRKDRQIANKFRDRDNCY